MNAVVTDSVFDLNQTENYKLSIQVSLDGFSFSIINPRENRLMATGNSNLTFSNENFIGQRFDNWYNKQELLKHRYSETNVYYYSENFSIIPGEFYDFQRQSSLIENVFGKTENSAVRDIFLPEEEANLVFSIPDSLIEILEKHFPGKKILHPVSEFIKKLNLNYTEQINNSLTALLLLKNSFFLLIFKKGKLQTTNNFSFKHPNDILYYTASVLKSLNINYSETVVLLSGDISETDDIFNPLSRVFTQTEFFEFSAKYNADIFNRAELYKFATLI